MRHLLLILFLSVNLQAFAQGTQLLREPTVSGSEVVFVYADDLWKTSSNGGDAIRLTSNEGSEFSPHFSPDGTLIAFTAEYDGNMDVYLIAAGGGEAKRLTFHPSNDIVQGWTPTGEVLFSSGREAVPTFTDRFYSVAVDGGFPTAIELSNAAFGEISPDGKHIAYVPLRAWDAEWRNYRGGQAVPIWILNTETKELTTVPQPTKERHLDPVWLNTKVYYISERDYTSNIWSFDILTEMEEQITFHKKFDVKSLDSDSENIIYEQGGYLHLLNPETSSVKQLNILVNGDMNFARSRWEDVKSMQLTNPNISPTGKRAIFEHRGEIFTIPKENGTWQNITNSPGIADRTPVWSPKGDKIAWFSDKSGEYELVVADQDGANQKYYTLPNHTFYFQPDWSPDGNHIAYSDTDYAIWTINLENGTVDKVAADTYAHPNRTLNPVWSPDSKWIAYPKQLKSHFKTIFAYNITTKQTEQLTDGMADAISPVWDINGKYLYFLASTNYGLQSGWLDMSSYDTNLTRNLYAIVLSKTDKAPTLPKSDKEELKKELPDDKDKKKGKKKEKETEEDTKAVTVTLDADGIFNRIVALELEDRNYMALAKGPENTIFIAESIPNATALTLHKYDVEKMEAEVYATEVSEMVVSADRKNILLNQNGAWLLSGTDAKPDGLKDKLNIDIKIKIDPTQEYKQIFKEGWRFMRDFLYVDNVHGAPWDTVYEWYAPWVAHVRHRTDLNYLVDILSGEVSVGHSFVYGGDFPDLTEVPVGLLGADLSLENGFYKIEKIYSGEDWNPDLYAPLAQPGNEVSPGNYIIKINGKELAEGQNPYDLLEQTAGREITITVNSKPSTLGGSDILVKPVESERGLRTYDWMEGNRRKVDELSNGKLAYVYVPNTAGGGFTSFNRYYFSQQDKKGVIVDERNNGGGSAADYMIDIMSRELFGYFNSRSESKRPWTTPIAGIWGPKVMLINENAGSGGDLLPYMFHAKQIGPLVGTRTWGGLVGTWDTPFFIDGGKMVAPRGGFFDVDGNWAVEGEGISPDIEVIQEPKLILEGKDPQLEKGVQEAMRLLEKEEFRLKPEPAAPKRWKRPDGWEKSEN